MPLQSRKRLRSGARMERRHKPKEASNLKRIKLSVKELLSNHNCTDSRRKLSRQVDRDQDTDANNQLHVHSGPLIVRAKARKEMRKEQRKLKKIRLKAYAEHRQLPTLESLAAEKKAKELEIQQSNQEIQAKKRKALEKRRKQSLKKKVTKFTQKKKRPL